MARIAILLALAIWLTVPAAKAQNGAAAAATIAADLVFPTHPTPPDDLKRQMALLVPPGQGPFAAVALVHQCAGLNPAIMQQARALVGRGLVVLMIDSFGPRDVTSVCYGASKGVNLFRGLRDALQAVDYLRNLPQVDRRRVAIVGASWGGMVALMAASATYRGWLRFPLPPAAVVAHYPGCFSIKPPNRIGFEVFNRDSDVPVLALLGGADTETPAAECERKFREANIPESISWTTYPNATHCWDCKQIDGLQRIDVRGNHVSYRFDPAVTEDAMERTFRFVVRPF